MTQRSTLTGRYIEDVRWDDLDLEVAVVQVVLVKVRAEKTVVALHDVSDRNPSLTLHVHRVDVPLLTNQLLHLPNVTVFAVQRAGGHQLHTQTTHIAVFAM